MPAICAVCGKGTTFGRNIRHQHSGRWVRKAPRTNRTFRPNLHKQVVHVGNGIALGTLLLAGNGTHAFGSLVVDNNSTLTGNGTIGGIVATLNNGTTSGTISQ